MDFIKRYTSQRPVLTGIILMAIALGFRLIDIFVLRLDERLGEIILSKTVGFCLVLLFLYAIGKRSEAIGFHGRRLGEGLLIGLLITVIPFIIAYTVEWTVLQQMGQEPRLLFSAIDPKAGVTGGLLFASWLVFGNFINSFMEKGALPWGDVESKSDEAFLREVDLAAGSPIWYLASGLHIH